MLQRRLPKRNVRFRDAWAHLRCQPSPPFKSLDWVTSRVIPPLSTLNAPQGERLIVAHRDRPGRPTARPAGLVAHRQAARGEVHFFERQRGQLACAVRRRATRPRIVPSTEPVGAARFSRPRARRNRVTSPSSIAARIKWPHVMAPVPPAKCLGGANFAVGQNFTLRLATAAWYTWGTHGVRCGGRSKRYHGTTCSGRRRRSVSRIPANRGCSSRRICSPSSRVNTNPTSRWLSGEPSSAPAAPCGASVVGRQCRPRLVRFSGRLVS